MIALDEYNIEWLFACLCEGHEPQREPATARADIDEPLAHKGHDNQWPDEHQTGPAVDLDSRADTEYVPFDDAPDGAQRGKPGEMAVYDQIYRLQSAIIERPVRMRPVDPALVGTQRADTLAARWGMIAGTSQREQEVQRDVIARVETQRHEQRMARKGRGR